MYLVITTTYERFKDGTPVRNSGEDSYEVATAIEDAQELYRLALEKDNTYSASICVCVESTDYDTVSDPIKAAINSKGPGVWTYWDRGLGNTLEFAERLGWVDKHPDANYAEWNADMADDIEEEALEFIRSRGYHISSPPPKDYPLPQMKSATRAS